MASNLHMQSPRELILASSSPYRRQLLEKLHIEFRCQSPEIDETPFPDETAEQLAKKLSYQKAHHVASQNPGAIVIASDQTAECNNQILNKPGSNENAAKQLTFLSGKTVIFHTGLCVVCLENCFETTVTQKTEVTFRKLAHDEITRYIEKEPASDCVGAFKSEGLGISLLEKTSSNDPNSLIGLPLIYLADILRDVGFPIP